MSFNSVGYLVLLTNIIALTAKGFAMQDAHQKEVSTLIKEYGGRYKNGYADIARGNKVTIHASEQQFTLDIEMDNPTALSLQMTLQRSGHVNYQYSRFAYPDFPKLTDAQLQHVDAAFKKQEQIFLLTERNQHLVKLDLNNGYQGVSQQLMALMEADHQPQSQLQIDHYYNPPYAVLFYQHNDSPCFFSAPFALWVSLETNKVEGANWMSFPQSKSGKMSDAEFDFINDALQKDGHFGIYGDVTAGLEALLKYDQVQIRHSEDNQSYWISTTPKNGFGHSLRFGIDKTTAEVSNPIVMHEIPSPKIDFDNEQTLEGLLEDELLDDEENNLNAK